MEHDYYLILFVDDVWLLDIFIFNDNVQFPEGNIPQYFININRNRKVLKVSIQDSAFSVFFFQVASAPKVTTRLSCGHIAATLAGQNHSPPSAPKTCPGSVAGRHQQCRNIDIFCRKFGCPYFHWGSCQQQKDI